MFGFLEEVTDTSEQILTETINLLNEVNKVQFDKQTKKKRLLRQCELIAAKRAGSPLYEKYFKATKVRKKCRQMISQQFQSQAKAILKEFLQKKKASK